jgi:hypothetical protein
MQFDWPLVLPLVLAQNVDLANRDLVPLERAFLSMEGARMSRTKALATSARCSTSPSATPARSIRAPRWPRYCFGFLDAKLGALASGFGQPRRDRAAERMAT